MAQNLIRLKQLEQSELTGLMQNVIASNEYTITYGGTGINIQNVALINLSGITVNLQNSIISGGATGYFDNLFINGQSIVTGSAATQETLNNTGNLLYSYIQQLSGDFDTSGAILNSYINSLSGDFNETGAILYNYINVMSGNFIQTGSTLYNYINAMSGDFNETGALLNNYINNLSGYSVLTYKDQSISGIKTFVNNINVSGTGIFTALDLNNIDILSLSGVDIVSNATVVASNLVYNTGNQTISGTKIFANSGIFSLSGANPLSLVNNPLSIVGSGNTYIQVNIQNRATGTTATSDLVITANNGTDTSNYIDLGINNSGYNDPTFSNGSAYDGYLFVNGGSLDIGTQTPGKDLEFHIGGTTADRVIARIDNSGINILSGTYRVNNTGVLLSGQNSFIMPMSSSSSNLTNANTLYYFSIGSAGYSNNRNDRQTPFLDSCIVKKVSFSIQQNTLSTVGSNVTGFFINTTKNLTGIIFSGFNTVSDNNFYTFSRNDLNIPFDANDSGVCGIFTTTANATNIRSMVNAYCYN